jgi:hypothetical protein
MEKTGIPILTAPREKCSARRTFEAGNHLEEIGFDFENHEISWRK